MLVNKVIYIILAIFLGSFGAHKFYAKRNFAGFIYLILCWTFIPAILSIWDIIVAIMKTSDENGNIYFEQN